MTTILQLLFQFPFHMKIAPSYDQFSTSKVTDIIFYSNNNPWNKRLFNFNIHEQAVHSKHNRKIILKIGIHILPRLKIIFK